ncbi:HD domain-containing protein [Candidatus Microgenomates bacterium]|nr:MAG: HD domain-containing protein [Candidatus Microgenomates bacterium]
MQDKHIKINVPVKDNELLEKALEWINNDPEIWALWKCINVNAIERLGYSDHGSVHFQIVANISLRLMRMLKASGIEMSIEKYHKLTYKHAELVVLLSSLFHDLGMSIHRDGHEEFSLFIANNLLRDGLSFLPKKEQVVVTSETLHAIISHRSNGKPYTLEAGIVRVADALDMSEGRSRIPYEAGELNIHSVSASAITNVEIVDGKQKPIQVNILMNNSAGLFQVDDLLSTKLSGSGLEKYVSVRAHIEGDTEKKLVREVVYE